MAFLLCSSPGFADEIEADPAGNTTSAHQADPRNLLSLDLHGSIFYLPYPDPSYLGLGFEHAFRRFTSLKAGADFKNLPGTSLFSSDHSYALKEMGLSLEALVYPFGRAPRGMFIGGYSRLYQRELLSERASSIRLGFIGGYNWRLFKALTLGLQVAATQENVLSDQEASPANNWYQGLIWEKNMRASKVSLWFTLGWLF
jgi:hypothetical protein